MNDSPAKYLIWSFEHNCWWGADNCGYVSYIASAGRYTREAAMKICKNANYAFSHYRKNPEELAVLEADALEMTGDRPPEEYTA